MEVETPHGQLLVRDDGCRQIIPRDGGIEDAAVRGRDDSRRLAQHGIRAGHQADLPGPGVRRGQGAYLLRESPGIRDRGIEDEPHGLHMQGCEHRAEGQEGARGVLHGAIRAMHTGQVPQGIIVPPQEQSPRESDFHRDRLIVQT